MDELLPTPTAGDGKSSGSRNLAGSKAHDGVSLTDAILFGNSNTSRSSPGSEGLTSPSKPSATAASDRSSGTLPAPESSSDGGRLFPDGETSPGSDSKLLQTPSAADAMGGHASRGGDRSNELLLKGEVRALLPTPTLQASGRPRAETNNFGTSDLLLTLTSSSEASPASRPAPPDAARAPRTIAGYGPSSPVSLASWDRDTSSWRTFQGSLLSTEDERFPRSWETWPTWGMTRHGQAFALPTSALPTAGNGSSSLPTPAATDSDGKPRYDHRASPGYTRTKPVPNLMAQITDDLLPTPTARDIKGERKKYEPGPLLPEVVGPLSRGDRTPPPSNDGNES